VSHGYRAVQWNRQKRIYDLVIAGVVVVYLAAFLGIAATVRPEATVETLILRAFGTLALFLLHVVLSIGPLARLDPRLLPLLYNRRHLGVTMFLAAAVHGVFATVQFHALGDVAPLASLLSSGAIGADGPATWPFQPLGFVALVILFLMASTSHDFWLANLTAPVWKSLHMLVYVAYGLVVLHVVFGILQDDTDAGFVALLGTGFAWVVGVHLVAGFRERAGDRDADRAATADGFVRACRVDDIPEGRARTVCLAGERVAIFRYDGRVSAVSNVCRHQNGPLGEGKIVDGCITCPWHGYQYLPETGASPPPFTEKVPTFRVRIVDGDVFVDPRPNPAGTRVPPARIGAADA